VIAAHISGCLNLNAEVIAPIEHPHHAFDKKRFQYDAGKIISRFESMHFPDVEKMVAVFSDDLFIPIFSHVFGEARLGGKFALVSLFRLDKQPDGSTSPTVKIYERAAKVALHEIGHLYRLAHCDDNRCLMHFTGGLQSLDEISLNFCRYCHTFFQDVLPLPSKGHWHVSAP
jgi:archaemetzincin